MPKAYHFQDIITGDELISDSYDLKEVDGVVYEADCKKITLGAENFGMLLLRSRVAWNALSSETKERSENGVVLQNGYGWARAWALADDGSYFQIHGA